MDTRRKAAVIVACTTLGAIAGYLVDRHIRETKRRAADEAFRRYGDEVVYGYEEAVERAKAKIEAQREAGVPEHEIEDGVKAIGPMPQALNADDETVTDSSPRDPQATSEASSEDAPTRPWNDDQSSIVMEEVKVTEAEMFPYHRISGGEDVEDLQKDPRPDLPQESDEYREADLPDVKPWPTEKDGKYFQISEDKYRHEEPWFDKMSATYFTVDRVLAGWDEQLEPLKEEEELLRRCFTLASAGESSAYFRHLDDERDVEVVFSDAPFAEAKAEV